MIAAIMIAAIVIVAMMIAAVGTCLSVIAMK
jgi:hypothetical protein